MRKLIEALTIFDWITPTLGFIEDMINDPTLLQSNSWTFFMPYDETLNRGWDAFSLESLLNKHGINTWGGQITGGEFFFSVKLDQAQWAEYLLLKNGVPLNDKYVGAPSPKQKKHDVLSNQKRQKSAKRSFWLPDDFFESPF